jgi:nucleoside-diphosphate-sugar epimerase
MTLIKDLRQIEVSDFRGVDAVVHMAELSNDPVGQLAPNITYEINHAGSVRLAELARQAGAQRFVYMSSCSVYGVADGDYVDETSPINPQTAYAICKTRVERDVKPMANDRFSPTFLRNATAYGASPHMRFDIVLNNLAGLAWTTKEIRMTSDGTPWRPLVHGLDICRAIISVLEAPRQAVHNEVFNVGDTQHNYRVKEIAEIVAETFPGCQLSFGPPSLDNRSYRVSFEKIRKHLPGFGCAWDAKRGARQLYDLFKRIDMPPEVFHHRTFTRLKQIEYLLRTSQIDEQFFWKEPVPLS